MNRVNGKYVLFSLLHAFILSFLITGLFLCFRYHLNPLLTVSIILLYIIALDICNSELRLIKRCANPNFKDKEGKTPLMLETERGKLRFVKHILEAGADVNAKDNSGRSALMLAADSSPLLMKKKIAQFLIEKGADVNAKDDCAWTALRLALRNGNIGMAELLLKNGADVNAKDKDGISCLAVPLYFQYAFGNLLPSLRKRNFIRLVKLLLDNGADCNIKNNLGETVLMLAAIDGHMEIISLLLEKGADVNAKDKKGNTALMLTKDHPGIIKLLTNGE